MGWQFMWREVQVEKAQTSKEEWHVSERNLCAEGVSISPWLCCCGKETNWEACQNQILWGIVSHVRALDFTPPAQS